MKYMKFTCMLSLMLMLMSIHLMFKSKMIIMSIPMIFNNSPIYISMILDWMSMMFMSTVLIISSMIIMFSMFYIEKSQQNQFIMLLMMFILSMIILILSDNLIIIILGWDMLGLTSYILVVFYQNASSSSSGTITILSNRMGDIAILLSMSFMMFSMNWQLNSLYMNMPILLLLMIAAISKSAQFPFAAWLPAAMAAPTPISALVHSSTLVTAGVYLMIRVLNNIHPNLMIILMLISSITSIFSSLSAMWENDMKKIIAMSTLSQIAIMMFSISIGSYMMAFFHLITHAFFKSSMFLCAGFIIHSSSYQDMRFMSSMYKSTPIPMSMLGLNSLALMGIPFMSGFFSKDAIIEFMLSSYNNLLLSMLMISSIGMTSMYTIRMNLFSSKFMSKSKPDLSFSNNISAIIPLMLMSPISIFLGSLINWLNFSHQIFLIPNQLKLLILTSLFSGMIISILLLFQKKYFISLSMPAISLWFSHFLTTNILKFINPSSSSSIKMDTTWQEIYGPNSSFMMNIYMSSNQSKIMLNLMILMLILILTPVMVNM